MNEQFVLFILGVIIIPALGYLTLATQRQDKRIIGLENKVEIFMASMSSIKSDIEDIRQDLRIFVKTEVDTLKELAKRSNGHVKEG